MVNTAVAAALHPTPLGAWRFGGQLGHRLDTVLHSRIASRFARDHIHPELLETLRARVDDQLRSGVGMWQGEFWGKWMLSAVGAARYRRDGGLEALIGESVDEVLATQEPDGYIGTYSNPDFLVPVRGQNNWNVWGRKYILWALLSVWELLEDDRILRAAADMVDHLMTQVGPGKVSLVRTGALFGLPSTSILTPVVMLYEATGNARYLDFAAYIVDEWARHPAGPPDILHQGLADTPVHTWFPDPYRWAKSYEFMSCVEGLLHLYRVTGYGPYREAATNIYHQLRVWERSIVGSISFNDKFVGSNRLINTVGEVCDVVYWNRLSFELLRLTGETLYADEFERSLYNALLAGTNPEGTWGLRRLRLSHQHIRAHRHCGLQHQQCCVANAPRGLLQAAEIAWMTNAANPRVRGISCVLYNPGEGEIQLPSGQSASIRVSGAYPIEGNVSVKIDLDHSEAFALRLRVPAWSETIRVHVNGLPHTDLGATNWATIERTWHSGDSVDLELDMRTRTARFEAADLPSDDPLIAWSTKAWADLRDLDPGAAPSLVRETDALPHRDAVAFLRGPLVLARDVRLGDPHVHDSLSSDTIPETPPDLRVVDAPEAIWLALEATDGSGLRLCNFSSAGNTWGAASDFCTWITLKESSAE